MKLVMAPLKVLKNFTSSSSCIVKVHFIFLNYRLFLSLVALVHKIFFPTNQKDILSRFGFFQIFWSTEFPCAKFVIRDYCLFYQVKCMVCTPMEEKEKLCYQS